MNEKAYEAANATHPTLRGSATSRVNDWIALAKNDRSISDWHRNHFPIELVADLTRGLFACDDLLKLGDVECKALYPTLYATYSGPLVPQGTKLKTTGNQVPAVLVATEKYLTGILWLGEGFIDQTYETASIKSVRQVKVGGMMVVPKYDGIMLEVVEDGEQEVGLFLLPQMLREKSVQTAFAEIRSALGLA